MSCAGSYDKAEEDRLIDDLYSGNFSRFLNPKGLELKKLYNTDPASFYYIGLTLKKAKVRSDDKRIYEESARAYFEYALEKAPTPYKKLAEDELYDLLSNEEKLKRLEKKLALAETAHEDKSIIEKLMAEQQRILFLSGNIQKMVQPLPLYLSDQKFEADIIEALKNIEKDKAGLKALYGDVFFDICEARQLVFNSLFKEAWLIFKPLIQNENDPYLEYRMVLSDLGKAALSGSNDYASDVLVFENQLNFFEKKSNKNSDYKVQKYMYAFYAARIRLKMGGKENVDKAVLLFKKAQNYAPKTYDYDVALWYVLDIQKTRAFPVFLDELCAGVTTWKNPTIYEDLISYACVKLVSSKDWQSLEKLQKAIANTKLDAAKARHAYILARSDSLSKEKSENLYLEAYKKDNSGFYYRAMAAYHLGFPLVSSPYGKKYTRKSNSELSDEDSITILNGFVKYKLYAQLYNKIVLLYSKITPEEAVFFSQAAAEHGYYSESMRIMSFAVNSAGSEFSEDHLKFIYPRPWLDSVKKYSEKYSLPEYLLYALLRSESYFKADVVSHAGAIGLAQLMKPTAADIAHRLKIDNYSLNDPDTNINFGAFYLSDMIRRNGGKIMHALFSYNAGPNVVKRWVRQAKDLPADLFLESLAYAETRGYGRNVLATAVIYGHLYYGKNYAETIKELFFDIKK